jgi:hypothetical protein
LVILGLIEWAMLDRLVEMWGLSDRVGAAVLAAHFAAILLWLIYLKGRYASVRAEGGAKADE